MTIKIRNRPLSQEIIEKSFDKAIHLAVEKWGATAPNPSVGCVFLNEDGVFLASGAHPYAGAAHAEIIALENARKKGVFSQIHHAFVTLEPCAHYGRTPPCSEALLESPVKKIWIGARDPHALAAGGGEKLRNPSPPHQGREVVFADELAELQKISDACQALIMPFKQSILKKRPWITVKQAIDEKGSMIPPLGQKTFSSAASLEIAHLLRRATDGIITARGTIFADHPSFTVRYVEDHIFPYDACAQKEANIKNRLLLVGTQSGKDALPPSWCAQRKKDGFSLEVFSSLEEMMRIIRAYQPHWLMVEAGPSFLEVLREASLWDDWLVIEKKEGNMPDRLSISIQKGHISPLSLLLNYQK